MRTKEACCVERWARCTGLRSLGGTDVLNAYIGAGSIPTTMVYICMKIAALQIWLQD